MTCWVKWVEETGGDLPEKASALLIMRLMAPDAAGITGQFLAGLRMGCADRCRAGKRVCDEHCSTQEEICYLLPIFSVIQSPGAPTNQAARFGSILGRFGGHVAWAVCPAGWDVLALASASQRQSVGAATD